MKLEYEVVVLSGRVKNFPIGFGSNSEIPVLPCSRLAELVVKYHHYVATLLPPMVMMM